MYNFKKNTKLYISTGSDYTPIEVYPDISLSQRFSEKTVRAKTLHELNNLHDGAVIQEAEEGQLSFTTPIRDFSSLPELFSLGVDFANGTIDSFTCYVDIDNIIYKASPCIVNRVTFNLARDELMTASFQISFGKKEKVESIPGSELAAYTGVISPIRTMTAQIDNTTMENIAAISVEIANNSKWLRNNTIDNAGIVYPAEYVITDRVVSGSITQYLLTTNEADFSDTSVNSPLSFAIGGSAGNHLNISLPSTTYTRRMNSSDVYTRSYDFRLNSNSSNEISIVT